MHNMWYGQRLYDFAFDTGFRTPEKYPYSYDPYFIQGDRASTNGCDAVYDDRMRQWNPDKFRDAKSRVYGSENGGYWMRYATPHQMSDFMSIYYGKQIRVYGIAEGCNVSNGYPYWIVYFKDVNED